MSLNLKGTATINAYGGYNNAGVNIGTNTLTIGDGVTLNALGGAKAPDVVGTVR
jgi:hypothetical protein